MKLSAAQQKMLNDLRRFSAANPMVGFASDRTVKRLLALNLITFTPTAYGAGHIRLKGWWAA